MDRPTYEELKALVEYGDAYFVDDSGETRNVRAICVDADGRLWLAEDPADLEARRR